MDNRIILTERLQTYRYRLAEEFDGDWIDEEFVALYESRVTPPRVWHEITSEPYTGTLSGRDEWFKRVKPVRKRAA